MAGMLALKRGASRLSLPSMTRVLSASTCRAFNTSAQVREREYAEDDRNLDFDRRERAVDQRRGDGPSLFTDVFDPLFPQRSLSQVLNLMDQFIDNPLLAATRGATGGARRGWDVREDDDALHLRMDMPGLGKEHVKVYTEQNTLVIRGEAEPESEGEPGRKYSSRIDIPANLYKLDGIKAEMKNGVLKVKVPRVKEEERHDVVQVQID
ncbi:small heat shock protein, chloroplastic [Nymphaea colorata]|nr:small heat shock protein, chloroplastic [Nymphaea colorata]